MEMCNKSVKKDVTISDDDKRSIIDQFTDWSGGWGPDELSADIDKFLTYAISPMKYPKKLIRQFLKNYKK